MVMKCCECQEAKLLREFPTIDCITDPHMIQTCLDCLSSGARASTSIQQQAQALSNTALVEVELAAEKSRQMERAGLRSRVSTGRVTVIDFESMRCTFPVSSSTTLAEFKACVKSSFKVSPDKQCLMYNKQNIEDRLDKLRRTRVFSEDDVSWEDLHLPLNATLQLLVLMWSSGLNENSISSTAGLTFDLCWDYKHACAPVDRHLNAVCIAVERSGDKVHYDFESVESWCGVSHQGRSSIRCDTSAMQMYQRINIQLEELSSEVVSLYFILCSVPDMETFTNTCIELVDSDSGNVLDTYTKQGASGTQCAMIMACARKRSRSGRWLVMRLGEVCRGSVTRTRKDYVMMDAAIDRLEEQHAHI